MREIKCILILLLCFESCISLSLFDSDDDNSSEELTWPSQYHLLGEELTVHTGLKQTFEIWYSAEWNRSRIDYYGGISKKYYYGETNETTPAVYTIHPVTTEDTLNKMVCTQSVSESGEIEDFLPKLKKMVYTGNRVISDRTVQVWEKILEKSVYKVVITVIAYVQDDVHIPVQITMKTYNVDKGNLEEYTITNYYGYESTFEKAILDIEYESAICDEDVNYGKNLDNDLKYLHPGISMDTDFAFQRYKHHLKKDYEGDEHDFRQAVFQRNWKYIVEHNKKNLGYRLEVNEFADRTDEELWFLRATRPSIESENSKPNNDLEMVNYGEIPEEFDLRLEGVITPVKNQDNCGSCWAFCTTAAVEGAIARKNGGRDLELSEQSLIDCAWGFNNMGCVGGLINGALKYVLAHGIPTDHEYGPYLMREGRCDIQNMTTVYKINGFGQVTPRNSNAMKVALFKYGPVIVGVHVSKNMKFYSSGIFYDVNCEGEQMNHGVTVVGYGVRDGDTYWIVKNSWGESWGEDGYILMSAMNNNCLLLDNAYYPIA